MLLEPMLSRLAGVRNLRDALRTGLCDFVALHGCEMGDVQFCGVDGDLVIVEAIGVNRRFLEMFRRVSSTSDSACGRAARDEAAFFVANAADDPSEKYREMAASVPFRSVLSCPLTNAGGGLVGMMSALSAHAFSPTRLELDAAKAYCSELSREIARLHDPATLAQWAEERSAQLVETTAPGATLSS